MKQITMEDVERPSNVITDSGTPISKRICICVPMTGMLHARWAMARWGQIIPVNWSAAEFVQFIDTFAPLGYSVADARNICVDFVIEKNFEWMLFIDHDVILPQNTFVKMNAYMREGDIPVVCGLYNAKGEPPEPLIFQGRGNSYATGWKPGDKVWADGIPMGCTLINMRLMKAIWEDSEEYQVPGRRVRKVFVTPRQEVFDPITGMAGVSGSTEDIFWCDRVITNNYLEKTGFWKVADRKYPFLVDTSINCGHIDLDGRVF
jgi:hypothetical protein